MQFLAAVKESMHQGMELIQTEILRFPAEKCICPGRSMAETARWTIMEEQLLQEEFLHHQDRPVWHRILMLLLRRG